MYQQHFGLNSKPFSLTPDPDFLFLGKNHQTALTLLNYGLSSEAGLTVISGEVGSGKTTLIRRLLDNCGEEVTVGLISNAHGAFGELLEFVLMAYGLDYHNKTKTELYQVFSEFLIEQYAQNKRTALIIDEAQNLDIDTLEELRMLTNINQGKHMVLQLIMVGQPELLETMRRPELRQLAQRVSVDFHLHSLKLNDTIAYIRHRLTHVGGDPRLFHPYASAIIYYHSQGIPRLINTLCDFALVYAFAEDAKNIDVELMMDVVRDKHQGGIFPLRTEEGAETKQLREHLITKIGIDISDLSAKANQKAPMEEFGELESW